MARPKLTTEERFWSKVDRSAGPDACWPWTAFTYGGYGRFDWGTAHRAAWKLTVGPIPHGMCVCHHCDNPPCVNPSHLFLGTNRDNIADRDAKGRQAKGVRNGGHLYPERLRRGETCYNAKLTEPDVMAIRASTETNGALARRYSMTTTGVRFVRERRTWKHLP